MSVTPQVCERARGWASLRADGELSELESALLEAHLRRCLPCRRFACAAASVASVLRSARPERPAPLELVLPRRRSAAARSLKAAAAGALVVTVGALAALVGADRQGPAAPQESTPVVIVARGESPDALRELRRTLLLAQVRQVPRNRRVPAESA